MHSRHLSRGLEPVDECVERANARAVRIGIEVRHVEQNGITQTGTARSGHIDVIQVADVNGAIR